MAYGRGHIKAASKLVFLDWETQYEPNVNATQRNATQEMEMGMEMEMLDADRLWKLSK